MNLKKVIKGVAIGVFLIMLLGLAIVWQKTKQKLNKDKVVAIVNNVPIYEWDAGLPEGPPFTALGMDKEEYEETRQAWIKYSIEVAIDNEVLLQEARKRSLNEDALYLEQVREREMQYNQERRERLAALMKNIKYEKLAKRVQVPGKEVDDRYKIRERETQQNRERRERRVGLMKDVKYEEVDDQYKMRRGDRIYSKEEEAFIRRDIHNTLLQEKTSSLYQQRLSDKILESDIRISNQPISKERLFIIIQNYLPAMPKAVKKNQPIETILLFSIVKDALINEYGLAKDELSNNLALLKELYININGRKLYLKNSACMRFFEAIPTAAGESKKPENIQDINSHGLSLCLFLMIEEELLIQEAEKINLTLPQQEIHTLSIKFDRLKKQNLIALLLGKAGIFDEPAEIPERRKTFTKKLRAKADIKIMEGNF